MNAAKIIKVCDIIIEYGLLAIVFFIPLIFDFFGLTFNAVDTYKAVAFRVILTLALLAYLIKIFISGRLNYRGSNKIFWLVVLLALCFFISSFFSIQPEQSFWGNFFRQQGFYNYFYYWLFFILLILNANSFKQIERLAIAALVAASLSAVYGLVQYLNLDPVSWTESAAATGRIFSTLGQPNWFGHYLTLVLPLGFYALFFITKGFWFRFFIGLSLVMQLLCLALAYSRAAWLGFFGAALFLFMIWLVHRRLKTVSLMIVGLILILVGGAVIIGLNGIEPFAQNNLYGPSLLNRVKDLADFNSGSNKMRLYYLEASWQEIKQAQLFRLLLGYGPETLADVFIKYYQPDWGIQEAINGRPDRAHNWFFDQFLALGLFGLLANLFFYCYLIYQAGRFLFAKQVWSRREWLLVFLFASLAAYCINNLFSFSLLTNFIYLFLILALVWLVINQQRSERTIEIRLPGFSKILIGGALFVVSAIFIYNNNIKQVGAEIYYIKAIGAMRAPDCGRVMDNMEKVVSLSPNNSYYQENFLLIAANCFFAIGDEAAQVELYNTMLSQIVSVDNKESFNMKTNIARAYSVFGSYVNKTYYGLAEKMFNELIADYPNSTFAYEDLGRQKIWQEDYRAAIKIFEQGLTVLPPLNYPNFNQQHRQQVEAVAVRFYENIGQAYLKLRNYDQARFYFEKILKIAPYRTTAYKGLADAYYLQGRLEQAIVLNQRGFMLSPTDYHWPLALSLLYREKKDLASAKKYLAQALELAPENTELKQYQGELGR